MTPAALSALVKGDIDNFFVAALPGGIERQEAQGQRDMTRMTLIPKEISQRYGSPKRTHADMEKFGFKFNGEHDDIFLKAELPPGWTYRKTEHSMWSEIYDDKDRLRYKVFYKAAFYDRSALIHFTQRYSYELEYPKGDYDTIVAGLITDGGKSIHRIEAPEFKKDDNNKRAYYDAKSKWEQEVVEKELLTRFPKAYDVTAYWTEEAT